ncbi:MAG: hypothetical protein ACRDY6_10770 [Acidimicrobiia bacterium]
MSYDLVIVELVDEAIAAGAVGLALSQATLHSDELPDSVRIFFGEGLFLVAAWVGIWYPLDVLLYSPTPTSPACRGPRTRCGRHSEPADAHR